MPLLRTPLRPIAQDEIDTFWRDGVVCLRNIIPMDWIDAMSDAIEEWLLSPECLDFTAFGAATVQAAGAEILVDPGTRRGRFYTGQDHWTTRPAFRELATRSPLVEISARLLKSRKLNLYEDSILVKEPGTLEKTAFHQDISYFNAEGHQICTTWLPLDPVRIDTGGLQFVRGSHLWKAKYRPNFFVTDLMMPGTEGDAVPDFHKDKRNKEFISFSTEPGDLTVHHARTIHGANGNASSDVRRRAVSVRYCGDDVRYHLRKGIPRKPHHEQIAEGDVMDHVACPAVWTAELEC